MVQVIRKNKENTISLLKRFSNKMRQSGNLPLFKSSRFTKRKVSKLSKKRNTIKKIERLKEIEKLYKLGKTEHRPIK